MRGMPWLPVLDVLFWVLLGGAGGWGLHYLLGDIYANSKNSVAEVNTRILPGTGDLVLVGSGAPVPQADSDSDLEAQHAALSGGSSLEQIRHQVEDLLEEGRTSKAKRLLRFSRELDEYSPLVIFLRAKVLSHSGQKFIALRDLLTLKNSVQAEVDEAEINALIQSIEREYRTALVSEDRLNELLALYEMLTRQDPGNAEYYYRLADTQFRLNLLDEALATYSQTLNDPVWGKKTSALLEKTKLHLDLKDRVKIPLERIGDHFVVNARINGVDSARLMIDTGATLCTFSSEVAGLLGLPTESGTTVIMHLASGSVNAPLISVERMEVGGTEVRNLRVGILDFSSGLSVDGLLGMNFLKNFRFFIDQNEAALYLDER